MRPLYDERELAALHRRIARWRWGLAAVGAAALAGIVLLMAFTTTLNAPYTELAAIGVSTLAGWILIYGILFQYLPCRREAAHAAFLAESPAQPAEGTLTLTGERVKIAKSITARRVELTGPEGVRRLLVCDTRAAALMEAAPRRVYAAHGYVAGWEETP